jgi:hypothetical protein
MHEAGVVVVVVDAWWPSSSSSINHHPLLLLPQAAELGCTSLQHAQGKQLHAGN